MALTTNTSYSALTQTTLDNDTYLEYLRIFRNSFRIHDTPISIALVCAYSPLLPVSLFGNLLVLFVILRNKKLRVFTNTFMINLALADLLGKYIARSTMHGQYSTIFLF